MAFPRGMSSINAGCLPGAGFVDEIAVMDDNAVADSTAAFIRSSTVKIVGIFAGAGRGIPAHRVSAPTDRQRVMGDGSFLGIGSVEILMATVKTVIVT